MVTYRRKLRIPKGEIEKLINYLKKDIDLKKEGIAPNSVIKKYEVDFFNGVKFYINFNSGNESVYIEISFYKDGDCLGYEYSDSIDSIFTFSNFDFENNEECEYVLSIESQDSPFFIVLEGGEATGKSTIANELLTRLQDMKKDVILTREPGGVLTAEKIRELILEEQEDGSILEGETEAYLFAAARNEHVKKKVIPALQSGTSIIMDRYFYSSLAYQGVARGLDFNKVYDMNKLIIDKAYPDLTICLKITSEERKERLEKRGIENRLDRENEEFMDNVDTGYKYCLQFPEFIEVDASGTVEEVVEKCLREMKDKNLI